MHFHFAELFFRPSLSIPGFQSFPGGLSWKTYLEYFLAFNQFLEDFPGRFPGRLTWKISWLSISSWRTFQEDFLEDSLGRFFGFQSFPGRLIWKISWLSIISWKPLLEDFLSFKHFLEERTRGRLSSSNLNW